MSTDISRCILIRNQLNIVAQQYHLNYGKLWSRDQTTCPIGLSTIQQQQQTLQSKKDYLFQNHNNNTKLTKKQHYAKLAKGEKHYICN